MNKLLVFTTLFLSSLKVSACGYSPYGEDVRYCLFSPKYFNYGEYKSFYYNNYLWGYNLMGDNDREGIRFDANILDWYQYTHKNVPIDEIVLFNDNLKRTDIHAYSPNKFLKYLFKNRKYNVITYLTYAKRCEDFSGYNAFTDTTWERDEAAQKQSASKFEKELVAAYMEEKNRYLKRKYAFLCIRQAFYNGNQKLLHTIFTAQFKNSKKDYLYYWSSYFNSFGTIANGNFNDVAAIFANSPEKTFASQFYFTDKFKLEKALQFAQTPEQVAHLYAYASARIIDKNLYNLKVIYQNKPKFRTLDFLLLREINKIEDWVYTPFYTNYSPSLRGDYYSESGESKTTTQTLRQRAEKDRLYARQMLDFVSGVDFKKVDNPVLWRAAEIQLLFITRDFDRALAKIAAFDQRSKNEKISAEIEKIKALCLIARQPYGKAIILGQVLPILQKNADDDRFVFALGRELEFKGNLLDGIALLSINESNNYEEANLDNVEWRGNRLLTSSNLDVFYNYFDYLDFVYPAKDLQLIIDQVRKLPAKDENNFIYHTLIEDKNYLADLLGTKYIREEKLDRALLTFRSLGKAYWQENYNAWERGKYDEYSAFDANPFYTIKHTPDFIPKKEKYFVNKLSITEHLIKYKQMASDPRRNDREYYYFLVANCYLNMTDVGNSWMMRRFSSYSNYPNEYLNESYIDNLEYRTRVTTREYYKLAYKNAKSEKFKALCLHMIDFTKRYPENSTSLVKEKYPQYYEGLSNCLVLDDFFNSRY